MSKSLLMKHFLSAIALAACFATLTNCGGGGGSGDSTPPTTRPKTLDDLTLILDGSIRFQFNRNIGSAPAVSSGDVETGAFTYVFNGNNLRAYNNTAGTRSDTRFPNAIAAASYSYRAINPSSGILTLTGTGTTRLPVRGGFTANNGSFTYLFENDSNFVPSNVVVIDITFTESGSVIASNPATVTIPGGDPAYDSVIIPTSITLTSGGPVPTNYNPTLDPNRDSIIAPESLNAKLFQFTHGGGNPALNFTIQFAADLTGGMGGVGNNNNFDEIGQGLLRVNGAAVDNAINYTYTRIGGTDDATLVISGSGLTFDGTYTVKFAGKQNGAYIGQVDAGTANAADVTGTFVVVTPS